MTPPSASRLAVRDLTVTLPSPEGGERLRVLTEITFDVGAGEIVALLGESGAGKSTTADAILRLLPPGARISGAVELEGRDLLALDERAMQRVRGGSVGLVLQDPTTALNPIRTVGWHVTEAVELGRGMRGKAARDRARAGLAQVGLDPSRFDAYPHELSGGMKQRAMLAIALAGDPEVLIADEPTASLDPIAAAETRALFAELARERGLATLLVTHDVPTAAELADRIVVLYAGEVVEVGKTEEILTTPRHPYTRALLDCVLPDEREKRREGRTLPTIPTAPAAAVGCRFAPRCSVASARCHEERPPLVATPGGESRCFLATGGLP